MKRGEVIQKLKAAAKAKDLQFEMIKLARHDAVKVGSTTKTLGRHAEINDVTARKFWDQFAEELGGKGWWR